MSGVSTVEKGSRNTAENRMFFKDSSVRLWAAVGWSAPQFIFLLQMIPPFHTPFLFSSAKCFPSPSFMHVANRVSPLKKKAKCKLPPPPTTFRERKRAATKMANGFRPEILVYDVAIVTS